MHLQTAEDTYRNANTVNTKVSQTKNAGTVSDDANLGLGVGPIPQDCPDRLPLLDRNVQSFGPSVEGRVLEADVADGGSVNQWHHLLGMIHKNAVEEVDVMTLDGRQVEIPVNVGLTGADHLERTLNLLLRVLHDVGNQTGQVLGDTLFGSKRRPFG